MYIWPDKTAKRKWIKKSWSCLMNTFDFVQDQIKSETDERDKARRRVDGDSEMKTFLFVLAFIIISITYLLMFLVEHVF